MTINIQVLRTEAKRLGINSYAKNAAVLESEINKLRAINGEGTFFGPQQQPVTGALASLQEAAPTLEEPKRETLPVQPIQAAASPATPTAPIRRTNDDAASRAKLIREKRRESGYDPSKASYKLYVSEKEPGWYYFWAIDKENRIFDLLQKGYERVETKTPVSAGDNSGNLRHILMRIPQEIYDEDFARKQSLIDDMEESLTRADLKDGGLGSADRVYGSIQIGQKKVRLGNQQ